MKMYRALLLGSVGLGLASYHAYSRDMLPTQISDMIAAKTGTRSPAASMKVAAADEAAPSSESVATPSGNTGVTSFYGAAERPDAEQAWAAPAQLLAENDAEAPAEATPAAAAPATAAEETAPASLGGQGVTSLYGVAEKADVEQTWSAPAAMNPEYSADVPAPAAAEVPAAAAPVPETPAPAAAEEEPAPASLGGQGVTSFYGVAEKADAEQAWAAPATVFESASAAPSSPANAQSAEGCRDALNAALQAGKLNFSMSSWDIMPDSYKTLDKIAKLAKDCGGVTIEIGGHTDNTGKPASNKTLSELRAQEVVKYLTRAGVEASKLKAVGYGQDKPVADNATREGRRQNRRIEFVVTAN